MKATLPAFLGVALAIGGCSKDEVAVLPVAGTVSGTLTYPSEAQGMRWEVHLFLELEDEESVASCGGSCGGGTSVTYTVRDVPPGIYYAYAVVGLISQADEPPALGDFVGLYGGAPHTPPTAPNVNVPSGGAITCDILLQLYERPEKSNIFSFGTPEGDFSAEIDYERYLTTGSGVFWFDDSTLTAYDLDTTKMGSVAMIFFWKPIQPGTYAIGSPREASVVWTLNADFHDQASVDSATRVATGGNVSSGTTVGPPPGEGSAEPTGTARVRPLT